MESQGTMAALRGLWVLVVSLVMTSAMAQDQQADFEALKKDIEAIKAGQAALAKDVAEIKKLLQPKPRPDPIEDADFVINTKDDPFKGEIDAKWVLVEFTDYQCPFCARHNRSTMPELEKDFLNTGKLKYVIRDFPLGFHKDAAHSAAAAHCAGEQGKYWEMHDQLFGNQKALGKDEMPKYAETIGLDLTAFAACFESGKYDAKIQASLQEGNKLGVSGTPTMFLGYAEEDGNVKAVKRIRGAMPYAAIKRTIEAVQAPAEKTSAAPKAQAADS